jgi:signal transduction histidine kinase/ActR/RegA family two-component response regulator
MLAMQQSSSVSGLNSSSKRDQLLFEQLKLLYANTNVAIGVTLLAAAVLGGLQLAVISKNIIFSWWIYMAAVSAFRFALAWRFHRASPAHMSLNKWRLGSTIGVALAGVGWGAAGSLLFSPAHMMSQVLLIFVLGGMMLGAASLLAPRPEAFLSFILPAGLVPTFRLFAQDDETHFAMGLLAFVFTIAILITTRRIYRTVERSLRLQIENRDLVLDLQAANRSTEALNLDLERRVLERTAELNASTGQLLDEIRQREQTEEELLRARKLESLGVLAGGIAHDFNNFLTVVQGNIEVARGQLPPEEPAQECLDQAEKACKRAAFLSSQLLTFAKGGTPVRRVVSIGKLVTDAARLASSGSPIKMEVTLEEDLWFAQVDPGQIGQALHNILLNARQAMPGGGTIEVHVENVLPINSPAGDTPRVRISIRDHGCGISPEVIPRIFDPYFTTKPEGSGLGLATAYAIVDKHGGRISVESTLGVGTVFAVELLASTEAPVAASPSIARPQTGSERILLMDDEEALRVLFRAVLDRLGYNVETAGDGAEAISLYEQALAKNRPYDAVLLDLTVIGGMGGVETAAKLKQLDPASRLIVSSGYSDAPVMSEFEDYGFDAVILKPWTVKEISDVLRRVIDGNAPTNPTPPM